MKLSELSYREYIALEALPALVGKMPDKDAAWRAFGVADAFLKQIGRDVRKVDEANARAEKAELAAEILRNMNEDGQFAARVALEQIWEFLGVGNQTAAMEALRGERRPTSENSFRAGFAAGHQFGLGTTMRCNEHSDGADRAWKAYSNDRA